MLGVVVLVVAAIVVKNKTSNSSENATATSTNAGSQGGGDSGPKGWKYRLSKMPPRDAEIMRALYNHIAHQIDRLALTTKGEQRVLAIAIATCSKSDSETNEILSDLNEIQSIDTNAIHKLTTMEPTQVRSNMAAWILGPNNNLSHNAPQTYLRVYAAVLDLKANAKKLGTSVENYCDY